MNNVDLIDDVDPIDDQHLAVEAALPDLLDLSAGLDAVLGRDATTAEPLDVDAGLRAVVESSEDELDGLGCLAARGDRAALGSVLERIRPVVARYCSARLAARSVVRDADDLTQEVLLAVCAALPRYRAGEPFLAFVYGIARRKAVEAIRRPASPRRITSRTEFLDVLASERLGLPQIQLGLDRLSEQQRGVLVLRIVMGFSAEETARIVGSTPGAVRVTQQRALARLRELLAEQPPSSAIG